MNIGTALRGRYFAKAYSWLIMICMTNLFDCHVFLSFGDTLYSNDYTHILFY